MLWPWGGLGRDRGVSSVGRSRKLYSTNSRTTLSSLASRDCGVRLRDTTSTRSRSDSWRSHQKEMSEILFIYLLFISNSDDENDPSVNKHKFYFLLSEWVPTETFFCVVRKSFRLRPQTPSTANTVRRSLTFLLADGPWTMQSSLSDWGDSFWGSAAAGAACTSGNNKKRRRKQKQILNVDKTVFWISGEFKVCDDSYSDLQWFPQTHQSHLRRTDRSEPPVPQRRETLHHLPLLWLSEEVWTPPVKPNKSFPFVRTCRFHSAPEHEAATFDLLMRRTFSWDLCSEMVYLDGRRERCIQFVWGTFCWAVLLRLLKNKQTNKKH